MGYRQIIKRVQLYSGFSDVESKDALDCMVESLAVHLNEGERKDFAEQLPEELQDIALTVMPTEATVQQDILEQFMENQHVEETLARKQILASWHALRDSMSPGEIDHITDQLPGDIISIIY